MTTPRIGRLAAFAAAALLSPAQPCAQDDGVSLEERIEMCGACHGESGMSEMENAPDLAGQPKTFIETQMIYFRERLRSSEEMVEQARGLDDKTIIALAEHYAGMPHEPRDIEVKQELFERGRELSKEGRCGACHLPDYSGRNQMPRLAGQREDYLNQTMIAYREQTRGGPDSTMIEIMRGVPDGDIAALAHYFAAQGGER